MYDNADYACLNQLVSEFDWSEIKSNDINSYAMNFTDTILEFCNVTIPNKLVTIRPSAPPWLNSFSSEGEQFVKESAHINGQSD